MKLLDWTLALPEHNLACDEALLDLAEEGLGGELLRFWEPEQHFVVLGISNKIHSEANTPACQTAAVPILRRCSGGGTVLQGPGCLNFSLILKITPGPLSNITETTAFILQKHRAVLETVLGQKVQVQGISDLTLGPLKFSGNAQRRKRNFLLFHGTFLLHLDLSQVTRFLGIPERKPEYRGNRRHEDFITNLNIEARPIKKILEELWGVTEELKEIPSEKIETLVKEKYADPAWTFKF